MVGQVLHKITVDVDVSPARDALESFASARPSRGMRRKWARACAAIRARRQGLFQVEWNGTAVSVHLHRDLLPLMVEAHLRARWLRGAM